jgi:hypothetical protein
VNIQDQIEAFERMEKMMPNIKPPWTKEQVDSLNALQKSGIVHPYTCGGNRTDENHLDGEGVLVATENGWMCPYCDYRQDWAHWDNGKPRERR